MHAQVGEFGVSGIINTVPLLQFFLNPFFFSKTNMNAMREIGCTKAVMYKDGPKMKRDASLRRLSSFLARRHTLLF